ncbi:hypothetical protein RRG08_033543 [Elysia crispata]|uniref:Uncharacterized protein n=1 Tax=Elysia crispata TaxID=231223 RepID=A0AAE1CK05_9GAST|nr:hypothetical protein RRG08_033543 [Elysia crispata]
MSSSKDLLDLPFTINVESSRAPGPGEQILSLCSKLALGCGSEELPLLFGRGCLRGASKSRSAVSMLYAVRSGTF